MSKEIKKTENKKCCMTCAAYRAMVFADDGTDAYCGKCTIIGPSGKRVRAPKSALSHACADYVEAGHGKVQEET